ncbi:MAG TPA: radical SAM protein, partial [bacterium]|nr:radical SAM protein [bacterium]
MMTDRIVFGPVPSRRLGRSLGIDLVPYKTCTYDCRYCQLGRTTDLTVQRREYVPIKRVLTEVAATLATNVTADYLTLSGSGEPTLHTGLGEIIAGLKRFSGIP